LLALAAGLAAAPLFRATLRIGFFVSFGSTGGIRLCYTEKRVFVLNEIVNLAC
jgi:hypothetical protein